MTDQPISAWCHVGVVLHRDDMPHLDRYGTGWVIRLNGLGYGWEIEMPDDHLSARDLESWLLGMIDQVRRYIDGDRGGPTPEMQKRIEKRS